MIDRQDKQQIFIFSMALLSVILMLYFELFLPESTALALTSAVSAGIFGMVASIMGLTHPNTYY